MPSYGENPLQDSSGDRLERRAGARSLARDIRDVDASEGYVVGIVGPWGSGKTSIISMVREQLLEHPKLVTIDFNPWVFSGTSDLIDAFFRELSAEMKLTKDERLTSIAETIDTYGELLSPATLIPFIGGYIARMRSASKVYAELQEKRRGGVNQQRKKVSAKLAELGSPIVVVIDDIDRLESAEIREIFKLVRLTGSFPNVIYVLAFDRVRVEEALSQAGFDGRAYLEKIVQLGADVPAIPEAVLLRQIGEVLQDALNDLDIPERFNDVAWPDVLIEIVRPLIRNMRDVRRYATAARSKARALHGQIELVDLLGLEAIRLFMPDLFQAVVNGRDGLTTPNSGFGSSYENPDHEQQVLDVIEGGKTHPRVTSALVERLFPAAQRHTGGSHYGSEWLMTWLKARRVAHPDVLAAYLEHVANDNMTAFSQAELAFNVLDDHDALYALLGSYELGRLQDVIASLEAFEDEYPVESVVPASIALLNLLPKLPERPQGMMTFSDTRLVVDRVVLRLLRRLDNEDDVMAAVQEILPAVSSLASRLEVVSLAGHREGAGHKLVSELQAKRLEEDLRGQIESASSGDLEREQGLVRLLCAPGWWWDAAIVTVTPGHPNLTRRILLDARSAVRSQTMGSRHVSQATRLNWDALVGIFTSEGQLKVAIDEIRGNADDELVSVIELADNYFAGWRPKEW